MKQISFWAHDHKVSARIAIILIYLLLNISGLFIGDILFSMDFVLPVWLLVLACMLTVTGTILYPLKKSKHLYLNYYNRQKFADGLLVTATFIFIVFTGNQFNNAKENFIGRAFAINIIPDSSTEVSPNTSVDKKSLTKKQQRKSFKNWIKSIRKSYKNQDKSGKIIVIILVVIGAIALSYLMIGLGCSIACSGAEALGYIVGIIGVAGVIFGAVKLIQRITRGKPKKEIETAPSQ